MLLAQKQLVKLKKLKSFKIINLNSLMRQIIILTIKKYKHNN